MQKSLFIEKYTPQRLSEFHIDPKINNAFKILIDSGNLNLILFGCMGCGKTSLLNAIIREYYGFLPEPEYRQNILFINNLQEQGINYYRSDVKTFCQTSSLVKKKKKIVVIDDIDMINEQSQQAFRNCIDKFSHNVCFLASCTNNQKVIESIQSRLTMIKLPPTSKPHLAEIFHHIANQEEIVFEHEATDFILSICDNTIKILINYIEKCKLLDQCIDYETAIKICSDIDIKTFDEYTQFIKSGNLNDAIKIMYSLVEDGYSVMDILNNYFTFVKITDKLGESEKFKIIPVICKYITTFHEVHENDIELPLFSNDLIKTFNNF